MSSSRLVFLLASVAVLAAAASCGVGSPSDAGLAHVDAGGAPSSGGTGGVAAQPTGGTGAGPAAATGGSITVGGGSGPAPECMPPALPYCGDGVVDAAAGETCDDGNALPGDGCTGVCAPEPYFDCPPTGGRCSSTLRCGDGMRSPGEACDDGNATASDGCAADCFSVDPGYYCPIPGQACVRSEGECGDAKVQPGETCDDGNTLEGDGCTALCRVESGFRCTQPGAPCVLVPQCGNGKKEGAEECDDSNATSADGCSSTCHVEIGWLCATPGMPCKKTVCGDGVKEGSECCDDGNSVALDGCTADCLCEPSCPTTGACTAKCGNGIVEGSEICDDGNTAGGDGCAADCKPEAGFSCTTPACTLLDGACVLVVPATFRDFNAHDVAGGHPDFQPGVNSNGAVQGLVEDLLDSEGKPVESALANANAAGGYMHGQAAFAQWYRNAAPASAPIPGQIVLYDNGAGGYVNRWGANGEQWQGNPQELDYGVPVYGGPGGSGCSACVPTATGRCYDPCIPWGNGNTDSCCAESPNGGYDGNPLFFPLDSATGILTEARTEGKVPSQYGWNGWHWESEVATSLGLRTPVVTATAPFPSTKHNYSFTTEVKYWFKYSASMLAKLDFTGDDDVWVFLNGHLAVDLGGWHVPLNGTLSINGATIDSTAQITVMDDGTTLTSKNKAGTATTYGLSDGNVYQIQIFHAERQVQGSSFKLTLGGFSMLPSDCVEKCGDGVVTVSEECDAGANNSDGACGACTTQCKFGPRCGDGQTAADCGEACDDGANIGGYNQCDVGCKLGPRCGDGVTQADFGEQCDDGVNNGMPGACTANCGVPGFCGDGVVQAPEECDTGTNDNSYGGCSADCHFAPRCGDGVVQADAGETCDLAAGNSNTAYGGCTVQCRLGPHCGDGIPQAPEQCDAGDGTSPMLMPMTTTSVDSACTELNSYCDDKCRIKPITER